MPDTARPYPATKAQKKRIHWGASALGLDEDTRRDLCARETGQRSTLKMSYNEARAVIQALEERFEAIGQRPPWRRPRPVKPGRTVAPDLQWEPGWLKVRPASCSASQAQLEIIRDRWLALARRGYCRPDKLQEALDGWLKSRFRIDGIHDLRCDQAKGVVRAVIAMEERS